MNLFHKLFEEACPICGRPMNSQSSNVFYSLIIKSCPEGHYEKELHPALEAQVEHNPR